NLAGAKLRTGSPENLFLSGGDTFNGTNYTSATGVSDVYWGAGTNNHMDANGMAMRLGGGFSLDALGYIPPLISSPFHQAAQIFSFGGSSQTFTSLVSVGGFGYGAFAHRTKTSPSNLTIQVV